MSITLVVLGPLYTTVFSSLTVPLCVICLVIHEFEPCNIKESLEPLHKVQWEKRSARLQRHPTKGIELKPHQPTCASRCGRDGLDETKVIVVIPAEVMHTPVS